MILGDDWIDPDMYKRMFRTMSEQDVDIVMCGRYENIGTVKKEFATGYRKKIWKRRVAARKIPRERSVHDLYYC